jgi:CheY-like chemotaxis protein
VRARHLVRQILAFSRHQPNELTRQTLRPLVEEAAGLLRPMVGPGVDITSRLCPQPVDAMANPTQLQQVLMNLGTNAWQALPQGRGHIELGLDEVELADERPRPAQLPPGRYARLWVSDNGCGMSEATRAHIFEPFFTTKPVGQGTGLGLAVAHGIVEAHHGAIAVTTTPGQGSRFEIYLPQVEHESAPAPLDSLHLPLAQGHGERVLYVDDDEVMVVMVQRLLERLGYAPTCVLDAREALALVQQDPQRFDVVVTDFNMPNLTGLELAHALAALRPDLPVAISSGYVSEELRAGAASAGVRGLMQKENTSEELGPLLQAALA